MTPAGAALIERLMPTVEAGIHAADDLTLDHEAQRLEAEPSSPVVDRLRRIVAEEQTLRHQQEGTSRA